MSSSWQFFDSQMAIFRRVRSGLVLSQFTTPASRWAWGAPAPKWPNHNCVAIRRVDRVDRNKGHTLFFVNKKCTDTKMFICQKQPGKKSFSIYLTPWVFTITFYLNCSLINHCETIIFFKYSGTRITSPRITEHIG